MGMMRSSVGRYLRFSFGATAAVLAPPGAAALIAYADASGEFRWMRALLVAAGVCFVVVAGGTHLWKRRPESADVSFGELMLWRFFRRARAEEKLNESARALGLDLGGRPLRRMQMSAAERLRILRSLAAALESKDPYTHGHSTRVEHLAVKTATALGLSEREIEDLRTAASLHDVGKIRIPTRVLRKPTELTVEEKLIVQEHSSVGAWMVSGVSNRRVVMSVRHHHERWDGNGYPDGVAGRDIPLFARIIAVADSYDAMTSSRSYRSPLSRDKALEEIRLEAGTQFDPVVVDAFLESQPRRIVVPAFLAPGLVSLALGKVATWGRRVGSTQAAETIVGAGIAAVVAASVFVPPAALPSEPQEFGINVAPDGVSVAPDRAVVAEDVVAATVFKRNENMAIQEKDKRGARKSGHGGDRTGPVFAAGDDLAAPDVDSPSGVGPAKRPSGPEGGSSSPPSGAHDDLETPDPPPPAPASTHSDPQPDKGRDCIDHPGTGGGGGNAKHCG